MSLGFFFFVFWGCLKLFLGNYGCFWVFLVFLGGFWVFLVVLEWFWVFYVVFGCSSVLGCMGVFWGVFLLFLWCFGGYFLVLLGVF